jgi:apolipoprotein N-acyltransferase
MLQTLAFGGSYGLGLLTMLLIAAAASLPEVTRRDLPKTAVVFALFMAVYMAGYIRLWQNPTEYTDLSLRLVQPNIPPVCTATENWQSRNF